MKALVAKYRSPFAHAAIGGDEHGAAFIATADQLEEQVSGVGFEWQIAELVDDEQLRLGLMRQAFLQSAIDIRLRQLCHQRRRRSGGLPDGSASLWKTAESFFDSTSKAAVSASALSLRCSSRSRSLTRRRSCRTSAALTACGSPRPTIASCCQAASSAGYRPLLAAPAAPRRLIHPSCGDQRLQSSRRRPALAASSPIARSIGQRVRTPTLQRRCTHSNLARHLLHRRTLRRQQSRHDPILVSLCPYRATS